MTYRELLKSANELQTKHSARWAKCVRNHLSFLYALDESGRFDFIPIKYLAHVIGGGDPDATRIEAKPSDIAIIADVLDRANFTKISARDSIFEQIFEKYLDHYRMLPGAFPDDYEMKRRGYAGKGSLNFWAPNTVLRAFDKFVYKEGDLREISE